MLLKIAYDLQEQRERETAERKLSACRDTLKLLPE